MALRHHERTLATRSVHTPEGTTTNWPLLSPAPKSSFPYILHLYYKLATSESISERLFPVLHLHYKLATSHSSSERLFPALPFYNKLASPAPKRSFPHCICTTSWHKKRGPYKSLACTSRTRHTRSPQRVARGPDKSHSRLHFAHSTRTISAEGCARTGQIALSPAFRARVTHYLRRGLRVDRTNRTLACISRTRHSRSPQRVARAPDKSHSRLHFAYSTRTISAEGCAHMGQIALSPAFRALRTHDLRRGLPFRLTLFVPPSAFKENL